MALRNPNRRTPIIHLTDLSEPVYHIIVDKQNEIQKECNCKRSYNLTISQIIKEWEALKTKK